jgi:hypothetical protein
MSKARLIRKEAPRLLEATKASLRYLLRQEPHPVASEEQKRQDLMAHLREALAIAEPPKLETITEVKLQMTPATWATLEKILTERAKLNKDDRLVFGAVEEGLKVTKQRVYVTLAINHAILRRLKFLLDHTPPTAQEKPFKRMAAQIEEQGLSKNPMELLAEMGL